MLENNQLNPLFSFVTKRMDFILASLLCNIMQIVVIIYLYYIKNLFFILKWSLSMHKFYTPTASSLTITLLRLRFSYPPTYARLLQVFCYKRLSATRLT